MSPRPTGPNRIGYIPALDGLRGVSLPGTIFTHFYVFLAPLAGAPHWLHAAGPLTLNIEMFFVLSGALITALLVSERDRTGGVSLRKFYERRFRRLGPALIAVVGGLVIASALMQGSGRPLGRVPLLTAGSVLLFLGNWRLAASVSGGLGWLGPAWTLGIEEQFYLTWPLLLRLCLRRNVSRARLLIGLAVVAVVCVDGGALAYRHLGWARTFHMTQTQVPTILLGCMLGYELATNPAGRLARLLRYRLAGTAGLAGMVAISVFLWDDDTALAFGGYLVYGLAATLLIGHCFVVARQQTWLSRIFSWKPFVIVGQISYEAYLVHWVVIITVLLCLPQLSPTQMIALDSVIIAAVSAAFYYGVERPIRRRGWRALFVDPWRGGVRPDPVIERS